MESFTVAVCGLRVQSIARVFDDLGLSKEIAECRMNYVRVGGARTTSA